MGRKEFGGRARGGSFVMSKDKKLTQAIALECFHNRGFEITSYPSGDGERVQATACIGIWLITTKKAPQDDCPEGLFSCSLIISFRKAK